MSGPSKPDLILIESKAQLVSWLESGCKTASAWRIGTEHEKFAFEQGSFRPLPYEGEKGIQALLEGMQIFGWKPVVEDGRVIALSGRDGSSITLEPGGQVELSGAPLETIHQTCAEVHEHLRQVTQVADKLGIGLVGLGFDPKWRREDIHWMPKGRYAIMKAYMPKVGTLGLDMMLRTCTVQANLDFSSEADMVMKFRTALALQPIATALFANSPFTEGKPNGYLSYRSHIWTDTDNARSGMLPFVFEPGMGFERYVDYLLDMPMYFVYRDGRYIDASGQSFKDFMAGRLPALPGEKPQMGDWADHVTTAFPEVRLKRYLEMRGADGGSWSRICALPALWTGLLYDAEALGEAWDMVKDWTIEEMSQLRADVPRMGLKAPFRKGLVRDQALRMLIIAREGLIGRAREDDVGRDESGFLDPLDRIAERGVTPAELLLASYRGPWHESVDPVYIDYAF
ncbi:MAG: glutamate--cysteine ligase [Alphaproteobacteria bacterium]|nr:glutamate--cysteine ligase [Alphaproteobacteria bacterium]